MRTVELPGELFARIKDHARATYPEECCGFLLSEAALPDPPVRRIRSVVPAPNESEGERRRRFVIPAGELRAAEEAARASGSVVCGFYHSHPDHPAHPSQFDQDHAWPWYSYLVVSVTGAPSAFECGAFELGPTSGVFERVPLTILPPTPPSAAPAPE